ncbi:high-affinity nickel-transporter [Caenispirillum salinarum AK4]|uniref:Nickel/cobalt efflux system n=1 Tax=Caenispirillum salinarum AK4 TaxID=1238182 RepID=K9HH66_9PROT|nr:nickel transporter [Caenispirillum salinarum]EKV29768.1 high-affinity nickel-transporter [Caenispirillum salinarum AK4]
MRINLGLVLLAAVVSLTLAALILMPDVMTAAAGWIRETQAALHGDLAQAVKDWQAHPGLASLAALATACFLYGVFHAVGPGHGKAVLSAYAATARVRLHQVLLLSALTATVQATVAVLLVAAAFLVAGTGMRWVSRQASDVLEPASYAAILLVGAWLVFGALRSVVRTLRPADHHDHAAHDHAHDGHCCGHHAPQPPASGDWRSGLALAAAAGLRPCTGSLLLVVLCFSLGLWGLGVAAPYIVGAGTAITVAFLAGGVHAARGPAAGLARVVQLPEGAWRHAGLTLRLVGGSIILLLGSIMLHAALSTPQHPFG